MAVRLADQIEIWRQGNYHWYRQIEYKIESSAIWWDQIDSNRLWFCSTARLTSVSVDQFINHSGAEICVQNGTTVNYTNYNQALIPPPMSQSQFPSHKSSPSIASPGGVLIAGNDKIIRYTENDMKTPEILCQSPDLNNTTQICISPNFTSILCVREDITVNSSTILIFVKDGNEWRPMPKKITEYFISQPVFFNESEFYCVGLQEDEFYLLKGTMNSKQDEIDLQFLNVFSHPIRYLTHLNSNPVYCVKSAPYFDLEKVPLKTGENVLSLAAHKDFLVATTTKHELVIWRAKVGIGKISYIYLRINVDKNFANAFHLKQKWIN